MVNSKAKCTMKAGAIAQSNRKTASFRRSQGQAKVSQHVSRLSKVRPGVLKVTSHNNKPVVRSVTSGRKTMLRATSRDSVGMKISNDLTEISETGGHQPMEKIDKRFQKSDAVDKKVRRVLKGRSLYRSRNSLKRLQERNRNWRFVASSRRNSSIRRTSSRAKIQSRASIPHNVQRTEKVNKVTTVSTVALSTSSTRSTRRPMEVQPFSMILRSSNMSINFLPNEILAMILFLLDDRAMFNASHVCQRWRSLVTSTIFDQGWKFAVNGRWPVFRTFKPVTSWFRVYCKLMNSLFPEHRFSNLNGIAERSNLWWQKPPTAPRPVTLSFNNYWADGFSFQTAIVGPDNSYYQGGVFYLTVQKVPYLTCICKPTGLRPAEEGPRTQIKFITKIYHPDVNPKSGLFDSCIGIWRFPPNFMSILNTIRHVMESPLHEYTEHRNARRERFIKNKAAFAAKARKWTRLYAKT